MPKLLTSILEEEQEVDIDVQITFSSKTEKCDPTYRLSVRFDGKEMHLEAPFMQWFTVDGYFVAKPFQQWLASSIPLVAEADPKNAAQDAPENVAAPASGVEITGSQKASRRRG